MLFLVRWYEAHTNTGIEYSRLTSYRHHHHLTIIAVMFPLQRSEILLQTVNSIVSLPKLSLKQVTAVTWRRFQLAQHPLKTFNLNTHTVWSNGLPLNSNRHQLSYHDCLELKIKQEGLAVASIARDDPSTLTGDDPFLRARMWPQCAVNWDRNLKPKLAIMRHCTSDTDRWTLTS